jgi:hypothetical protein
MQDRPWAKLPAEVVMKYYTFGVFFRTVRCLLIGQTDLARWTDTSNFDTEWEERTQLMARIVPKHTRVIEFGAGTRQLESYLDPTCSYFPSDLVDRGGNTIVLDLNSRPLPDLSQLKLDVAVFAGVLEYISDLDSVVLWLSRQVAMCIASYGCAHTRPRTIGRFKETIRRTGAGWINTFTEDALVQTFGAGGFILAETHDWHSGDSSERIFVFNALCESARH